MRESPARTNLSALDLRARRDFYSARGPVRTRNRDHGKGTCILT